MAKTKTSKKKAKKEIAYKSVGRNVILLIDGKKVSKAFKTREERANIQSLVETYNKRNSLKREKEIIELMQKGKTTEKERVAAEKEKVAAKKSEIKTVVKKKTSSKKITKAPTKAEIEAAKNLLESNNYNVTAKTVSPSRARTAGNHREF